MADGADAALEREHRQRAVGRGRFSALLAVLWWICPLAAEAAEVTVSGTVTLPPARIVDYVLLPLQDEGGRGMLLEAMDSRLSGFHPGQRLEATGTAGMRSGSPVIRVRTVRATEPNHTVTPRMIWTPELCGPQLQGLLVTVESRVLEAGENVAGETIRLREKPCLVQVFLPRTDESGHGQLARLLPGDRIRVTGVAMVYAPTASTRWSQILIASPSAVTVTERAWPVPPYILLIGLLSVISALGVWWMRLRRLARLRQLVRSFLEAGEAVLGAATAAAIVRILSRKLTGTTAVTGVRIYLLNEAGTSLDSVTWESEPARQSYPTAEASSPLAEWLGNCVRNRTLLCLPGVRLDTQAALLVPLLRQTEMAGVLQLDYPPDVRGFAPEEQMAALHLGNLVASSLERMEQQAVRERLFRTEKLAAVGQLISSVATDLRQPLEAIARAVAVSDDPGTETMREVAHEAGRAAELVARLGTIAQTEQPEAKVVDLRALLNTVCTYRRAQWETLGLQARVRLDGSPAKILGSAPQLENVFLNLLARAQGAAAGSRERSLSVALTATEERVQAEVAFSHDPRTAVDREAPETGQEGLGLGVMRGIIQSHGGELRVVRASANSSRFEVELALHHDVPQPAAPADEPAARESRMLTLLVVEPDEAVRRDLVQRLSDRHRVVPVSNMDEGRDLAFRLRFDGAFCAVRAAGASGLQFYESVKARLDFFVLLSEGFEEEAAWSTPACAGFVLRKPVTEEELARLLDQVESPAARE